MSKQPKERELSPSLSNAAIVHSLLSITNVANSLAAVSDERGDVRLLDTSPNQETGITSEYIRMKCHENAIFDICWSYDDLKLVDFICG